MGRWRRGPSLTAIVISVALCGSPGAPSAETTQCSAIKAVPVTLSSPGVYCLTSDLGSSDNANPAVTIAASNVVLDLNGHLLQVVPGGLQAGTTLAFGIFALDRHNVTVKNGTVRGFLSGVVLDDDTAGQVASHGNIVEELRVDSAMHVGILVQGHRNVVRNNLIVYTVYPPSAPGTGVATGILVTGSGSRILNNDVATVTPGKPQADACGIRVSSLQSFVVYNRVSDAKCGFDFTNATGLYRDNLATGITGQAYIKGGMVDAGNNH